MDASGDFWASLFDLAKTSPALFVALAPTLLSIWFFLRGTKQRTEEPARDSQYTQADRMFALLDKIQESVAKSSGHVEEIERIQQKVYEEMIRNKPRRE